MNDTPVVGTLVRTPGVTEGGTASLSGAFTEVETADTHTVLIAWGDGATTPASVNPVDRRFTASYRYADNPASGDGFQITATVSDGVGSGTRSAGVAVTNVAPTTTFTAPGFAHGGRW